MGNPFERWIMPTALELRDLFQSGQEIHLTLSLLQQQLERHYERLSGFDGKRKAINLNQE
jgi:hypothetical protein